MCIRPHRKRQETGKGLKSRVSALRCGGRGVRVGPGGSTVLSHLGRIYGVTLDARVSWCFSSSFRMKKPGQREMTGAIDLVNYYGLSELYNHFCKSPLPVSIADSPYLQQVVGDTEIRRGEGMELGQLIGPSADQTSKQSVIIQPLDLQLLQWAFTLQEGKPAELPESERGVPTISGNVKEDKDRKHKKKHKKHKHRHKDKDKDKKDKDQQKGENGEDRSKKHRKKKRKHDGGEEDGDGHKHKKKKDKADKR